MNDQTDAPPDTVSQAPTTSAPLPTGLPPADAPPAADVTSTEPAPVPEAATPAAPLPLETPELPPAGASESTTASPAAPSESQVSPAAPAASLTSENPSKGPVPAPETLVPAPVPGQPLPHDSAGEAVETAPTGLTDHPVDLHLLSTLPDWQQRVVLEKRDLDTRLSKLGAFISGDAFRALPLDSQTLLDRQEQVMAQLSEVLGRRIEGFQSQTVVAQPSASAGIADHNGSGMQTLVGQAKAAGIPPTPAEQVGQLFSEMRAEVSKLRIGASHELGGAKYHLQEALHWLREHLRGA